MRRSGAAGVPGILKLLPVCLQMGWPWYLRKCLGPKSWPVGKMPKMKTYRIFSLLVGVLLLAGTARAADEIRRITGEAVCARCELKLQDKCQTVIQAKEGDKVVNYYLADNDAAKAFHPQICHGPAQVSATGTVSTADGKQVLTVSTIEIKK
jgi:hypothetical protein